MNTSIKTWVTAGLIGLLSACASTSQDISLIPTQTDAITQKKGSFTQPAQWSGHQPGCEGKCPYIEVNSLVFPGQRDLTNLVDESLAAMISALDGDRIQPSISAFEEYYWKTADHSDEVQLAAKTIYRNKALTVLDLGAWRYHTGAAHGLAATQFINWSNTDRKVLTIEDIVRPRKLEQFYALQQKAHQRWVDKLDLAQDDPEQFARLWPFQRTENIALTDAGVLVKYDPYAIAPYAAGMPQFLIPYDELKGVLRNDYLPRRDE
ncbi:MAG TPA: RsiV family protein [Paenalcaligenes sp.]|nr:RsiV family protein [Paenalcaligenes sp.]